MADDIEEPAPAAADDRDPAFERLLVFLKDERSFDFTGYKRASLMRRVRHQMFQVGLADFDEYHDYLQVHPAEFTALFNTILINVSSFFRDPETWEHLATDIVPRLVANAGGGPIRVWSAGCASGQEPYSLAMMLADALGLQHYREQVKIYATDVDEEALTIARQATYTQDELGGVSDDYRGRFFEATDGRYAVVKELRRNVIFGRNDLVQDAPISRIDLLTCRNALMYFNAETQSRIVTRLGFALKPEGVLVLGKAEMLLNHTATFEALDLKRRSFRKVTHVAPDRTTVAIDVPVLRRQAAESELTAIQTEAFLASPVAQLVIDASDRLALVNHRATSMLALSDRDVGRPFQDLEVSYRPAELRSRLEEVRSTRSSVWIRDVEWRRSASDTFILDVQLVALVDDRGRLLGTAIMFNDVSRFRGLQNELESANRQLGTAYEELQSTNEELETTNEELQSTVEELETTNEELQSTNEELETMNEELQSMNDELHASNEELQERTGEVTSLNDFMESILGSLTAAVIVLDEDQVVQVWNRQAEELWGLREDETVGRHFLNLDSGLPAERFSPLVREALRGNAGEMQFEAIDRRGRTVRLFARVAPLVAKDSGSGGVLVLLEDGVRRPGELS